MKNLIHPILLFLGIFLIGSCSEKKSESLVFKSTDNNMVIDVSGEKPNMVDPWKVTLKINTYGKKDSLGLEIFSGELNSSTVHCDWTDVNTCIVKFDQQDNSSRIFSIEGKPEGYSFKEINSVE